MSQTFPEPIRRLPQADIPLEGCTAYLSQGENHQILFMEFDRDVDVPPHSHKAQWGVVVRGKIDLTVEGITRTLTPGDSLFIPAGAVHSAHIYAGYADVTYWDEKERYPAK
ncbi:cupin domain-containing protein [Planctomycetota bacterium]